MFAAYGGKCACCGENARMLSDAGALASGWWPASSQDGRPVANLQRAKAPGMATRRVRAVVLELSDGNALRRTVSA
jgi:hypothetical protein